MGLWARLINWLTSSRLSSSRKAHPDLYPIEVERIAKELRLAEQAKRLGAAGIPATDAVALTGPEAAVVQRVEKARQDYIDWAALRLSILSKDLGRRNVTQAVNRARQADKEFERKASALLAEQDAVVRAQGETARKRKVELEAFRAKHRLMREAHFPTGSRSFFLYAVLFFLIAVEGVLNANFFAQGLDSGLLGGFTEATILATVNVVVAFLLGKFAVRYANHCSLLLKGLGLLALAFSFSVMAAIGLGIAHYRDSLTAEVANPAKAALEAFIASPFHLQDFFSWALFAISIVFGIASLFDGLFSDDLYPGYGAISRRTQDAIDDHESELETLRANLEQLKNEELGALDSTLERAQADVAVFESLVENKQLAGSRLTTALSDADNSLDALLGIFRTENELHRNGAARPKLFDKKPKLKQIQLPDFDTEPDERALLSQKALVTALLAEVQDIRGRIQAAFNTQFDRLKPLELHFPSKAQ